MSVSIVVDAEGSVQWWACKDKTCATTIYRRREIVFNLSWVRVLVRCT